MMGNQDVLTRFREHLITRGMASATVVNYIADVRCFSDWYDAEVKWAEGGRPQPAHRPVQQATLIADIDVEHVRQYCAALHQEGRSVSTINRRIQALRKFYDFVEETGLSSSNPARAVERLDEPGAVSPRVLTSREMEQLLETAGQAHEGLGCRDGAILLLLVETGLKVGELVEIRVRDLRLEGEASPERCGTLLVGQNGSGRQLSLRSRVCQALEACLEMRASKLRRDENGADEYLFVNRQGQPLSVRSVQRLVSRYAQQAGLEGVSTRTLRHTFARRVLRRDLEPVQVARMLGLRDVAGVRRYLD